MHHGARADEHDGVLSMTQPDDDALFAHAAEKMTGDRELLNSLIDGLAEAMHHCAPTDENDGVLSMTQPDDDVLFADAGEAITCQRDMLDSLLDGLEDAMGHASFINERSNEHADASAHSATTIESRDQALLDRMVDDLVAAVAESETVHVDDVVETCGEMIDGGFAPHADDFIAAATPAAQAADMQRAVEGLLSSAQSPATPADDSAEVQSFDPLELNTLE
jgi:hypothetical protein